MSHKNKTGNIKQCLVCASANLDTIFRALNIPLYLLHYFSDRNPALNAERSDVFFVQCLDCGFLFNKCYKQLDYKIEYEANRSHSTTFNKYLSYVSERLTKYLKDGITKIVEVGAGDCNFTKLLSINMPDVEFSCYDPSWKVSERNGRINKFAKLYGSQKEYPDLIIARHVLEHQSDVKRFIATIAQENPEYIFIEIPSASYVLKGNYHYFSYEHCSYLDSYNLNILMGNNGYCAEFIEYVFNEENIIALYKKNHDYIFINDYQQEHNTNIDYNEYLKWKDRLLNKINKNDIIWGAAGKGVMMLNILNLDYKYIPFIVDINPNISGKFIPITGNEVIHPSKLKKQMFKNRKIIAMNKLYLKEINKEISELGINADVVYIGDL
jgi:hypothetical protein